MQTVVICKTCEGKGELWSTNDDFEDVLVECPQCKGTGKLIKLKYSYYFPFGTDPSVLLEIDEKVHRVFKENQ